MNVWTRLRFPSTWAWVAPVSNHPPQQQQQQIKFANNNNSSNNSRPVQRLFRTLGIILETTLQFRPPRQHQQISWNAQHSTSTEDNSSLQWRRKVTKNHFQDVSIANLTDSLSVIYPYTSLYPPLLVFNNKSQQIPTVLAIDNNPPQSQGPRRHSFKYFIFVAFVSY